MKLGKVFGAALCSVMVTTATGQALATPEPSRDSTWGGVSNATAVLSLATQFLMPRVSYPQTETTEGWKARWHVSQFAPLMTIATLTFINEHHLKKSMEGPRPGCDDTNATTGACSTFGSPSTQAFLATGALGYGAAVFAVDTFKYSNGRINPISLTGNVIVPLALSIVAMVGRGAGDYESTGQILTGATFGLASGVVTGLIYAVFQRPECGYGSGIVCW